MKKAKRIKKKDKKKPLSPQRRGETSVSGHMPEPEADDDVLETAHQAGLYPEAKPDVPRQVGLGRQRNEARRRRKHTPPPRREYSHRKV